MLLYTLVPQEVIFGEQGLGDHSKGVPVLRQITYANKDMLVSDLPDGRGVRIERLLSTEPADYLDPKYQPGNIVQTL